MNKLECNGWFPFLNTKASTLSDVEKIFQEANESFYYQCNWVASSSTDNDLDDKILAKVKSGMKLGVVWSNAWASGKWI